MKNTVSETVKLRGHHLICLHFYGGEGYGKEFIASLERLIDSIEGGKTVAVIDGPDDVCSKCPHLKGGKCISYEGADEEINGMDSYALELLGLKAGDSVKWQEIGGGLHDIMTNWRNAYCNRCGFRNACLKKPMFGLLSGGKF